MLSSVFQLMLNSASLVKYALTSINTSWPGARRWPKRQQHHEELESG